jgi:hypothetical protein
MADEAMTLPGSPKPPEDPSGTVVIKDPSQKKFWRTRNLILLVLTALLPVVGKSTWDGLANFFANHEDVTKRLERAEEELSNLRSDVKSEALWGALTEERNRIISLRVELEVLKKLFDREFSRAEPRKPDASSGQAPAPVQKAMTKEEIMKLLEQYDSIHKTEQFKIEAERKFPELRSSAVQKK